MVAPRPWPLCCQPECHAVAFGGWRGAAAVVLQYPVVDEGVSRYRAKPTVKDRDKFVKLVPGRTSEIRPPATLGASKIESGVDSADGAHDGSEPDIQALIDHHISMWLRHVFMSYAYSPKIDLPPRASRNKALLSTHWFRR